MTEQDGRAAERAPMKTGQETAEPEAKLRLPWDLTEWVDSKTLWHWVMETIDSLDWNNLELAEYLRTHPSYRPRPMLYLLTYAYVRGIYESDQIVQACHEDPIFRSVCENDPPSRKAVGRFRRDNRGLLKWSLSQLLKRAFKAKFKVGDMRLPPGLKRYLVVTATGRIDMARHMDRAAQGA